VRHLVRTAWVCLAVVCWAQLAGATLFVEESFDYNEGLLLNGLDGGTGWAGAWTANSHANFPQDIQAGNLADYPGLVNAGNHARLWACGNGSVYSRAERVFQDPIADSGQTVWWGFQMAAYGAKRGPADLLLPGSDTAVFSMTSDQPTAISFLGTKVADGDPSYTPHLFLVEIAMSDDPGPEMATCYVDPDLSLDPSAWTGTPGSFTADPTTGLTGLKWDGARAGTSMQADLYFDEIRFATTWQEAVGASAGDDIIPEPTTVALLALGGLGALLRRRRRA